MLHKKEKINEKEYWQCLFCGDIFCVEKRKEHIKYEIGELKKALKYLIKEDEKVQ